MSLNAITASLQAVLARTDCTQAQAQAFVLQGMAMIQRDLRLPTMERQAITTTTGYTDWVAVPGDLIELIDIYVPDIITSYPTPLVKKPYRTLITMDPQDLCQFYSRIQNQYWMRGQAPPNTTVTVHYYGTFTAFSADGTSDNEISSTAPDLCTYAGLVFAGAQFRHPNLQTWLATYQQLLAQVESATIDQEMKGGPAEIPSMYVWECD